MEKPNWAACGRMFAMIGRLAIGRLQRSGFAYSPDRRGKHPHRHLASFSCTLQADAYAGFNRLYDSGRI
jgi:hypothetical protein